MAKQILCRKCCSDRFHMIFKYLFGLLLLLILMQYGRNVYTFIQREARRGLTVYYGSVSNKPVVGNIGKALIVEGDLSLKPKHHDLAKSGWFISWMFQVSFSLKGSTCSKGANSRADRLVVSQAYFPEEILETQINNVKIGGFWEPETCRARYKVAIIVPYRDRPTEKSYFLQHMHPFLQRQLLYYRVFIVEQTSSPSFNRGLLLNIGFREAISLDDYDCVVTHDVDMLPEDDRILYDCPPEPRHLVTSISRFNYRLPYKGVFGGVTAFSTKHFREINGFSNQYFGWGVENEDLYNRVKHQKLKVIRYAMDIGRFQMLGHKPAGGDEKRMTYLGRAKPNFTNDGLNDLDQLPFEILKKEDRKLYTWYLVDVNSTSVIKHIKS